MVSALCLIDDKHVPIARVMWVADIPHFCGQDECQCEGMYEVRLEQGESVWGNQVDRDRLLEALQEWYVGSDGEDQWE